MKTLCRRIKESERFNPEFLEIYPFYLETVHPMLCASVVMADEPDKQIMDRLDAIVSRFLLQLKPGEGIDFSRAPMFRAPGNKCGPEGSPYGTSGLPFPINEKVFTTRICNHGDKSIGRFFRPDLSSIPTVLISMMAEGGPLYSMIQTIAYQDFFDPEAKEQGGAAGPSAGGAPGAAADGPGGGADVGIGVGGAGGDASAGIAAGVVDGPFVGADVGTGVGTHAGANVGADVGA